MPNVWVVNLELDMPSVDDARRQLIQTISTARSHNLLALKLVHGYGSTGTGGKLRQALRSSLVRRRKEGMIRLFVIGENWGPFDELTRQVLEACPELKHDRDLARSNPGITIVLL